MKDENGEPLEQDLDEDEKEEGTGKKEKKIYERKASESLYSEELEFH